MTRSRKLGAIAILTVALVGCGQPDQPETMNILLQEWTGPYGGVPPIPGNIHFSVGSL